MRENFKLKNKKEKGKEERERGGRPGERKKNKKKKKKKKPKKPKNRRRKEEEAEKKEKLVRQRQYGKFLHNREGRAHIFTHVQAHTHGKVYCYLTVFIIAA